MKLVYLPALLSLLCAAGVVAAAPTPAPKSTYHVVCQEDGRPCPKPPAPPLPPPAPPAPLAPPPPPAYERNHVQQLAPGKRLPVPPAPPRPPRPPQPPAPPEPLPHDAGNE